MLCFLQGMSETEARALSGVTYLGCGISIICLLLTLLCMVVFRYSYCKDSFSEYLFPYLAGRH